MSILTFAQLQTLTGYGRAGDVARCLRRQGIKVFLGKGGAPWTTTELLNSAGGAASITSGDGLYSADDFS